jgi:hypothetical protein
MSRRHRQVNSRYLYCHYKLPCSVVPMASTILCLPHKPPHSVTPLTSIMRVLVCPIILRLRHKPPRSVAPMASIMSLYPITLCLPRKPPHSVRHLASIMSLCPTMLGLPRKHHLEEKLNLVKLRGYTEVPRHTVSFPSSRYISDNTIYSYST